jgi:transcriptional regulator with XRE-family HTH domain
VSTAKSSTGADLHELRELRKMAGLSLQELAYRTGINRPKLSYAERGVEDLTAQETDLIIRTIQGAIEANAAALRRAEDRIMKMAQA